jgi:hypothetical protein
LKRSNSQRGIYIANSNGIKTEIEPAIRAWLADEFEGAVFEERQVRLPSGGSYKFDAVSKDGRFAAAIVCARAIKGTKKENTVGLKTALTELERLKALDRNVCTMMIFTDLDFSTLVQRRSSRLRVGHIKFLVCPLPDATQERLNALLDAG